MKGLLNVVLDDMPSSAAQEPQECFGLLALPPWLETSQTASAGLLARIESALQQEHGFDNA
jgi:hypothetical protein